jgi:hypothetical protein
MNNANYKGKDIYLLFYNSATASAATEIGIFRMANREDNPDGSTGIFPTGNNATGGRESIFSFADPDGILEPESYLNLLIGQYDSLNNRFTLGNLSGGIGQITSPLNVTNNSGTAFNYQITANNGANSFVVTSLPNWASLNSVTGVITLAPGAGITGTFTLGLSAINSLTGNTATGSLAVTVQAATAGPAFTSSAAVSAAAGVALSHTIITDAPSTFTATTSLPSGLTLDSATGVLSGIPKSAGTFRIVIRAARTSNAASFKEQNLTLTVSSPTLAIAALVSGQLTRTAGTAYTIPVTIPAGFTVDSSSLSPSISGFTYSAGSLTSPPRLPLSRKEQPRKP